jgi:hypothetical protein
MTNMTDTTDQSSIRTVTYISFLSDTSTMIFPIHIFDWFITNLSAFTDHLPIRQYLPIICLSVSCSRTFTDSSVVTDHLPIRQLLPIIYQSISSYHSFTYQSQINQIYMNRKNHWIGNIWRIGKWAVTTEGLVSYR